MLPRERLAADPLLALQLVALGRAVAVLPQSLRNHVRHDVACVPVTDAPPTQLLIAWPAEQRSRALAGFIRAATEAAADQRR
ncbi:LysR substrate-binding domain-containing protein [Micromonospora aurantiaca (nom. illeg.)]|uniref:LysR substrate-binding domain-containing protein n=1 Tax=Micromonospora aurantiaca (nom. illeg.) TaxID=47850 RepID=UPI00223C2E1C|nr:LysR substrate-binding domain-containing protein [Micromonospora aurantiaca]